MVLKHTALATYSIMSLLFVASSASAQLPAGYERMMNPDLPHTLILEIHDEWTSNYSAVRFNNSFTPGFRVIDLEIQVFDKHPSTEKGYDAGHRIAVVEVPNNGIMESTNWLMALGETEEGMHALLVPGNDPITGRPLPNLRPTDIELYYRHSPFNENFIEPTFAFTAVENSGDHYAMWDFIPPTPVAPFLDLLDAKQLDMWRPYDIEFAVDGEGRVVGTALLSKDEASGNLPVACMWGFFQDWQLANFNDQGWVLMDFEHVPLVESPYNFSELPQTDFFGVFVMPQLITADDLTNDFVHSHFIAEDAEKFDIEATPTRLTDLEIGLPPAPKKKPNSLQQATRYSTLWLNGN
ncbi:hypothetical protein [Stieleria varia]|uniref:Uncharacterized protein n=1 Tax=Stieleria varia TaxID=2528005 RepID=A0A5C6B2E7_9BACT|nr:hypothetical protein [Stieleria varia]TWU06017.1 hypothetical protein Pla52n_17340 [Stieleria varia]